MSKAKKRIKAIILVGIGLFVASSLMIKEAMAKDRAKLTRNIKQKEISLVQKNNQEEISAQISSDESIETVKKVENRVAVNQKSIDQKIPQKSINKSVLNDDKPVQDPIYNQVLTFKRVFSEIFSVNSVLEESGSMATSSNSNWWLNSGGRLIFQNGVGKTIQGDLPSPDRWFKEYAKYNPTDTDGGKHPQNLFRLVTKTKWQNFVQEGKFKINKYHLSKSSERYNPNGLLLFNRYVDGDNLYYTGVRVDGLAIAKKKVNGKYYTVAQTKVFPGTYNRETNPNLLPVGKWIGLRSEVKNNSDGTVSIKVFVDKDNSGNWTRVIDVKDNNSSYGPVIKSSGYAGIRTDFMDVEFDNYKISEY